MAMSEMNRFNRVSFTDSDCVPRGEMDLHTELLADLFTGLRAHFERVPNLYVACDLIVHYEKDLPDQGVVPDLFAVRGVGRHPRTSWLTWEEGAGPEFVLEVMSDSSRIDDQGNKKVLYAELGVKEYFLFDPQHRHLKPCLQGFRLVDGEWEPLAGTCLRSEVLGVDFFLEGETLRLVDACTGKRILRRAEQDEALRAAEEALHAAEEGLHAAEEALCQERQARLALEAEVARLRAPGWEDVS